MCHVALLGDDLFLVHSSNIATANSRIDHRLQLQ